jgi:recA bacterial DNA recombination protein
MTPTVLAGQRLLPVDPALDGLLSGGGLQRGTTVAVTGGRAQGATSLALALVAAATAARSWCGVVAVPDLGVMAASELGVDLDHLALVPLVAPSQWVTVVGSLLDGVDVVVARPPAHLRQGDARRLIARARERGAVLVPLGPWTESADHRLTVTGGRWEGPGDGDGRLLHHRLTVSVSGRGAASRPRVVELELPATPRAYAGADAHLIPDTYLPLRSAGLPLRSAG